MLLFSTPLSSSQSKIFLILFDGRWCDVLVLNQSKSKQYVLLPWLFPSPRCWWKFCQRLSRSGGFLWPSTAGCPETPGTSWSREPCSCHVEPSGPATPPGCCCSCAENGNRRQLQYNTLLIQLSFGLVQSLDWLGCQEDMRDDPAQIHFQSSSLSSFYHKKFWHG